MLSKTLLQKNEITATWAIARTWFFILSLLAIAATIKQPLILGLCFVLVGTMQYHLNILGHDGLHYALYHNRKVNDFVCRWFLHGPHFAPLGLMRKNHLLHHSKLGQFDDFDAQYYDIQRFNSRFSFTTWLVGSLFGGMNLAIVQKIFRSFSSKSNKNSSSTFNFLDTFSVIATQFTVFIYTYLLTDSIFLFLFFWVAPAFTIMMGFNTIRSCLEHALPQSSTEVDTRLFTFNSYALERFFISPFNMNFHAEHHAFPAVPYYNLPKTREEMLEKNQLHPDQVKGSYFTRFSELLQNFRVCEERKLSKSEA